jgi:hypothetical protein
LKQFKIFSLKSRRAIAHDRAYWAARSPEDRLNAMEILRRQWYNIHNERPKRISKVIRIIKLHKKDLILNKRSTGRAIDKLDLSTLK